MKILFFGLCALSLIFCACGADPNQASAGLSQEQFSENHRGLDKEKNLPLVRQWQSAQGQYLKLSLEGRFEAKLEGETLVTGTWALSEDGKELQLQGDQAQEGKGQKFNRKFEVLKLSDTEMQIRDGETVLLFQAG